MRGPISKDQMIGYYRSVLEQLISKVESEALAGHITNYSKPHGLGDFIETTKIMIDDIEKAFEESVSP